MTSSRTPDFARLAATYDELRPQDAGWWELFDVLVGEGDLRGKRVLDVGCGTGRLATALAERALARVWGIDPSGAMLEVARARVPAGVGLKQGRAEQLPFVDAWFDRAVLWLSLHLVDRPRALPELRRVLRDDGRLALATFHPRYFDDLWLNRFFPSFEAIDRARFPDPDALRAEFESAGFAAPRTVRLSRPAVLDRESALEKIRGRHISNFDLIGADEYAAGLERAERELPERLDYKLEWAIVVSDARPSTPPSTSVRRSR